MTFIAPAIYCSSECARALRQSVVMTSAWLLLFTLGGCGGGGGGDSGDSGSTGSSKAVASFNQGGCDSGNAENRQTELLAQINALRATGAVCGSTPFAAAPALAENPLLLKAAEAHALDMATQNYFAHASLDGRSPPQRVVAAGYAYSSMGENLAAGQPSVEAAMKDWIASPGHCQNLMNPAFRDVALACASKDTATYRNYWVMELGRGL